MPADLSLDGVLRPGDVVYYRLPAFARFAGHVRPGIVTSCAVDGVPNLLVLLDIGDELAHGPLWRVAAVHFASPETAQPGTWHFRDVPDLGVQKVIGNPPAFSIPQL
jgi:hypothetical protein